MPHPVSVDDLNRILHEPAWAIITYLAISAVMWWLIPKRYRIFALSFAAIALAIAFSPIVQWLGAYEFGFILQAGLLFAVFTLAVVGVVLPVDRIVRDQLLARFTLVHWSPYAPALLAGLVTTLGSLGGLYWVTTVHPEILGSLELALIGGVLTACWGIVRVDRKLDQSTEQN